MTCQCRYVPLCATGRRIEPLPQRCGFRPAACREPHLSPEWLPNDVAPGGGREPRTGPWAPCLHLVTSTVSGSRDLPRSEMVRGLCAAQKLHPKKYRAGVATPQLPIMELLGELHWLQQLKHR